MEVLALIYQIEIICLFLYSAFLNGNNKNAIQKYLFMYLLITNVAELLSLIGRSYFDLSTNGIIYNCYSFISLIFFYYFYVNNYRDKSKIAFSLIFLIALIYAILFTNFLKFEYDYRMGIILSLFYISSALFWLGYKIVNVDNIKITDHPKFYISIGLIIWSSFFIFRSIPMYLIERIDEDFQKKLRDIFYLINIIFYFLIFISILKSTNASSENE